jgi:enoyl-CoA hydratase
VSTHDDAVEREIEPQIWSREQPWFQERLAKMQARIASKKS